MTLYWLYSFVQITFSYLVFIFKWILYANWYYVYMYIYAKENLWKDLFLA